MIIIPSLNGRTLRPREVKSPAPDWLVRSVSSRAGFQLRSPVYLALKQPLEGQFPFLLLTLKRTQKWLFRGSHEGVEGISLYHYHHKVITNIYSSLCLCQVLW